MEVIALTKADLQEIGAVLAIAALLLVLGSLTAAFAYLLRSVSRSTPKEPFGGGYIRAPRLEPKRWPEGRTRMCPLSGQRHWARTARSVCPQCGNMLTEEVRR